MNQTVFEIITIFKPLAEVILTTVAVPAVAILATKFVGFLKIKDEQQRLLVEEQIRNAIHESAANGIRYAASKYALPMDQLLGQNADLAKKNDLVADAMQYVLDKNPDGLKKLGVNGNQLREIIMSKMPALVGDLY